MTASTAQQCGAASGVMVLLTLLFAVLQVAGALTWSWLWVLSPLWIPAGVGVAFLLVLGVAAAARGLLR